MVNTKIFDSLETIHQKPEPYSFYTTEQLWNDPYISKKMLEAHLNPKNDVASRNELFIKQAVNWIVSKFNIDKDSKICDFGCGPGLYTTRFAEIGANVTGIDFSKLSIDYAKKLAKQKKLPINYVLQDYLKFNTNQRFDLITMIYYDFCAISPSQRHTLLNKFYQLLKKDGHILLDVLSLKHFETTQEKNNYSRSSDKDFWSNFWSAQPYYLFSNTFKYEKEKVLLDKHTIIEKNCTRTIYNWLQCYSFESLKKEFQKNGLQIIEVFANIKGTAYIADTKEFAITAKKV